VEREREGALEGGVRPGEGALVAVGAEPVQGVRADLALDPLRAQARHHLVAAVDLDHVGLPAVDVARVGRRQHDVETGEPLAVAGCDPLVGGTQLGEAAQLRDSERAQDVAQAVVERRPRHVVVGVRRKPAVVAERADALGERCVVRRDRAALAGRDDLPRMEREAAEPAERAARPAAARRAERACGVLDHRQVRVVVERRRPAEEMHGEHGLRLRRHAARGVGRVHVHRHGIDVDEHRRRAAEGDDVAGGWERVRGHEHLVARPEPERQHREVERGRPRRHRDHVLDADGVGEQRLELLDLRAHRELPGREHLADLGQLLLPHVGRGEADYGVSAGFRARYHAIVLSRPSSSSTFASKPMSSRAFSTFGMRSSTST
jgi:hypothetical protein